MHTTLPTRSARGQDPTTTRIRRETTCSLPLITRDTAASQAHEALT
jgi:hypothetical protein